VNDKPRTFAEEVAEDPRQPVRPWYAQSSEPAADAASENGKGQTVLRDGRLARGRVEGRATAGVSCHRRVRCL
jgi:hypothetical protein